MVFFLAIGDGSHTQMIRAATDSFLGHAQVQHALYHDEPGLEHSLEGESVARILAGLSNQSGIRGLAPRVQTGGLVSLKDTEPADAEDLDSYRRMAAEGAFLVGIDPELERSVTTLHSSIVPDDPADRCRRGCRNARAETGASPGPCEDLCQGADAGFEGQTCRNTVDRACIGTCQPGDDLCDEADCQARFQDYCEPARMLADEDPFTGNPWQGEIVLGSGLAKVLDAGVGDRVALTSATARGRTFASLYRIAGLVRTGSLEINRTFALTHRGKLAEGLEIPGGATAVVMSVRDLDRADRIAADSEASLGGTESGLQVLSWRRLAPDLDVFVKVDQGGTILMVLLLVMIVAVILANVVTMSVMERTREYGVRLSLGESPNRIAAGLVTEVALLAMVFASVGALLGEALTLWFRVRGLDFGLGDMEGAGVVISMVIHPEPTLYGLVFSLCTVTGLAILGSLWPAWRIRRIRPVHALRFV
jgi:ABC-type lipoprotein release transport system permease subunit